MPTHKTLSPIKEKINVEATANKIRRMGKKTQVNIRQQPKLNTIRRPRWRNCALATAFESNNFCCFICFTLLFFCIFYFAMDRIGSHFTFFSFRCHR